MDKDDCSSSRRCRSTAYWAARVSSSGVSAVVSNHPPARRARAYSAGSSGTSTTSTSGSACLISSRSAGLSSKKTKLSRPRFRVAAIRAMLLDLGSQQASKAAKSSNRRIMSGFFSKISRASPGLFLDATARMIPRLVRSLSRDWKARNPSPRDCPQAPLRAGPPRRRLRPRGYCPGRGRRLS